MVACRLQAGRLRMACRHVAPTVGAVEAGASRPLWGILLARVLGTSLLVATTGLPPMRRLKLEDRVTIWDGKKRSSEARSSMATATLASLFKEGDLFVTALQKLQCGG